MKRRYSVLSFSEIFFRVSLEKKLPVFINLLPGISAFISSFIRRKISAIKLLDLKLEIVPFKEKIQYMG